MEGIPARPQTLSLDQVIVEEVLDRLLIISSILLCRTARHTAPRQDERYNYFYSFKATD